MSDVTQDLYDRIAARKHEKYAVGPYDGGNGRIDRAVDLILNEDFPRSGVLLDVGGATGNLGYALRDHFEWRCVVDIAKDCKEPALTKGNDFVTADIDRDGIPWKDGFFDLITALDFIEHIIDPQKFARECLRVLKPGGRVLINTPNIQYWRHLESLVCNGVFPHTSGDPEVYHGGHLAFYALDDMQRIFSEFTGHTQHFRGLLAEASPPIWENLLRTPANALLKRQRLCYADLIFSCKKP